MSTDPDRRVIVTGEASALRRRLGPTAWVVFEELLLASTGPASACCASVSVRSLAGSSGLAKDTVARALVRLRAAGLVAVSQSRSTGGVFAASNYELRIPSGIILDDSPTPGAKISAPDEPSSITRPTQTRPTRLTQTRTHPTRPSRSAGSQLVLVLDD